MKRAKHSREAGQEIQMTKPKTLSANRYRVAFTTIPGTNTEMRAALSDCIVATNIPGGHRAKTLILLHWRIDVVENDRCTFLPVFLTWIAKNQQQTGEATVEVMDSKGEVVKKFTLLEVKIVEVSSMDFATENPNPAIFQVVFEVKKVTWNDGESKGTESQEKIPLSTEDTALLDAICDRLKEFDLTEDFSKLV